MPTKTKRDEEKWDKAVELAKEQGHTENYAYIMGIYKKMNPDHEFKTEDGKPKKGCMINTYDQLPSIGAWITELELSDDGRILGIETSDGKEFTVHVERNTLEQQETEGQEMSLEARWFGNHTAAGTAAQAYKKKVKQIAQLLKAIEQKSKRHAQEFQQDGETNWGYVGDLAYVLDELKETVKAFIN